MSTDDSFSRIASLESALEAEKASHTDTLVKLRLAEERLKASEAERRRLQERCEGLAAGQQILVELMDDDEPTEPMAAKGTI